MCVCVCVRAHACVCLSVDVLGFCFCMNVKWNGRTALWHLFICFSFSCVSNKGLFPRVVLLNIGLVPPSQVTYGCSALVEVTLVQ